MTLEPIDVIPRLSFWGDGCRAMAQNVCKVLQRASEPVTAENILAFVRSLPRAVYDLSYENWQKQYCSRCLEKAYAQAGRDELMDYFTRYFPERDHVCQS